MKLYLVQYGIALPQDLDPEEGLSKQGLFDIQKVAEFLKKNNIFGIVKRKEHFK